MANSELPDHFNDLTPMQIKFAVEFARTGHGTNSAISAGYSPSSAHAEASRLKKIPKIARAIEAETAILLEQSGSTAEDVIKALTHSMNYNSEIVNVINAKGHVVARKMRDAAAANKAAELLGKHHRLFADVSENRDLTHEEALAAMESRAGGHGQAPDQDEEQPEKVVNFSEAKEKG